MLGVAKGSQTDRGPRTPAKSDSPRQKHKVLTMWEQQQILKHADLSNEVSERMAAKAFSTACSRASRKNFTASIPITATPHIRGEGQGMDKAFYIAWVRELADHLGVGAELRQHEIKSGTLVIIKDDIVLSDAPTPRKRFSKLHSVAVKLREPLARLGQRAMA